ncbi:MAG: ABC transporter permease [Actinomycetota bacterium]
MNAAALAFRQVRYENKSFWRNPASAFFTFAFPLMFLFIFGTVFGDRTLIMDGQRVKQATFIVPAIAVFAVISACFTSIAMSISLAREQGVLKRKRGTPMPPTAYLAGRILHATAIEVLLVAIVVAAGRLFYGVAIPTHTLGAFVVTLIVGALSFSALGFAITAAVPNAEAAPAVVNAVVLPLLFISDVFLGPNQSPEWMRRIADLFPIRHYLQAMLHSYNPFENGAGYAWQDLGIVAAWGLAGIILAVRFFKWEPSR